jgi:hypothetical protein
MIVASPLELLAAGPALVLGAGGLIAAIASVVRTWLHFRMSYFEVDMRRRELRRREQLATRLGRSSDVFVTDVSLDVELRRGRYDEAAEFLASLEARQALSDLADEEQEEVDSHIAGRRTVDG